MNVFYTLIVSLRLCVASHAQSAQNDKFAIFLQYLKKEVSNERDFLHADITKVSYKDACIKVSYKLILSLFWGMIKYSQITQRRKRKPLYS